MAMEVVWQAKAVKQLKKIGDRSVQQRIIFAARSLLDLSSCPNVKQLVGHKYTHRMRVEDWRVLLNVQVEIDIVSIEEIKKRDERTY